MSLRVIELTLYLSIVIEVLNILDKKNIPIIIATSQC